MTVKLFFDCPGPSALLALQYALPDSRLFPRLQQPYF